MGDINEYIYIHKIRSYLSNLGLGELIIGKDSSVGPATTISNKKLKEVYGIWGSQRLYITERGYLPFYMVPKIISRAHMDKIISRSGIWEQKPTFQIPIGHKIGLCHIRGQRKYTYRLQFITQEPNIIY